MRARLAGDGLELLDRGGPVNVRRDERHFLFLRNEQARELAAGRRLARALQARHQDHGRRLRREIERRVRLAHERAELAMHEANERLAGREAADHFGAERLCPDRVDEMLHHRQRDIRLEQRDAHLAQRLLDVRLREARFAADVLDDARESRRQVFEHG